MILLTIVQLGAGSSCTVTMESGEQRVISLDHECCSVLHLKSELGLSPIHQVVRTDLESPAKLFSDDKIPEGSSSYEIVSANEKEIVLDFLLRQANALVSYYQEIGVAQSYDDLLLVRALSLLPEHIPPVYSHITSLNLAGYEIEGHKRALALTILNRRPATSLRVRKEQIPLSYSVFNGTDLICTIIPTERDRGMSVPIQWPINSWNTVQMRDRLAEVYDQADEIQILIQALEKLA